jgi:membrane protein implicated in regulation of membrane protease activity
MYTAGIVPNPARVRAGPLVAATVLSVSNEFWIKYHRQVEQEPAQVLIDNSLAWLIAGFLLVIVELLTGTFYLLVLGIACFAGAVLAYAGGSFVWQAAIAAAVAVAGVVLVRRYKKTVEPKRMQVLDFGQPATFDSWVNKGDGRARVKYRDALWDAQIVGETAGEPGEVLYVNSIDGNALKVSKSRPA